MAGILVVDDNPNIRYLLRAFIESRTPYAVCGEAGHGMDAIDKAMPLMNGEEAAMVLRNTMPKVPIVLFTLYAEQLRGAISPGFGVTIIVSKTDGLAPLIESLERLLAA